MKSKKIGSNPDAYVLIFDKGDEIVTELDAFADAHALAASSFKAIGALASARLGWYDPDAKDYKVAADLDEPLELLSLIGDVGSLNGKPVVHPHAVVGRRDGTTVGGHLLHSIVGPTCELFLTEYPAHLVKEHDDRFNLDLFKLDNSTNGG